MSDRIPLPTADPDPPDHFSHTPSTTRTLSRDWRPWAIRAPFLVFFIFLCVLFPIIIEILLRISDTRGALIYADPDTELSLGAVSLCNYLPSLVAVLFGLLWAIPDHHYRRLEPYYQLSKPGGATAEDSLLLDYSYTSTLLVPFTSFKRGHWTVFCSGMMSNILTLVLIPLIAGVFEQTIRSKVIETEIRQAVLSSLADQNTTFSTGFSFLAYNREWLTWSPPAFISNNGGYAILPLEATGSWKYGEYGTWYGESVLYEADLNCHEAIVVITDQWFNISNGHDCAHNIYNDDSEPDGNPWGRFKSPGDGLYRFSFIEPWTTWFMGGYPSETYSLSSGFGNCSNKHTFLILWVRDKPVPPNVTALFCEASYWSQPVQIVVDMPAGLVVKVRTLGNRTPFHGFNIPRFEELITTGKMAPPPSDLDPLGRRVKFGYAPTRFPDPGSQLARKYPSRASKNLPYIGQLEKNSISGFVMARQRNDSLFELLDPEKLAVAYTDAFKMLFSFAVEFEMIDTTQHSAKTVTRSFLTEAFVVNMLWARLSVAGFVMIILFGVCLMVVSRNRVCVIDGEPGSIAASLMMISHNRALTDDLNNAEYLGPRGLRKQLIRVGNRYQLRNFGRGPQIHVIGKSGSSSLDKSRVLLNPILVESDDRNLVPHQRRASWLMSSPAGGLFLLAFTGLLSLVIVIYVSRLSTVAPLGSLASMGPLGSFRYKLLFSYTPTVLSMLIAPFWTELGMYACMIMPYETLRKGSARSSQSLTVDYDGMPPHLQLVRALQTRNPILVIIILAILLTNLLAVSLSGLFSLTAGSEVISTNTSRMEIFQSTYSGTYTLRNEAVYLLLVNLSSSAGRAPPWVTPEFFVLPFDNVDTTIESTSHILSRKSSSWGLGVDISCQFMPENMLDVQSTDAPEGLGFIMTVSHSCDFGQYFLPAFSTPGSDFALESKTCPGMFVVGWIEQLPNPRPTSSSDLYLNETDHIVLLCNWSYKTAEMLVTVDGYNRVLELHKTDSKSWSPSTLMALRRNSSTSNDTGPPIFGARGLMHGFMDGISLISNPEYAYNSSYVHGSRVPSNLPQAMYLINYLMLLIEPNIRRHLTNHSYLPVDTLVIKTFEQVYTSLFALHLQTGYDQLFENIGVRRHTMGTTTIARSRVAISTAMFAITTGILAFFILALGVFYGKRPGHHLSYLPTTMAGAFALLYASNTLEDVRKIRGKDVAERAAELEKLDDRYGYGDFMGVGRRRHFGVFKEPAFDETEFLSPESELTA
ncbi:hypothetical protein Q9L58_005608 [Maublancomyces gigas]|uniref:Formylmethionine deformylase-like protein n=1 Tax=Discina gigas TaxID=1032678 RepID=A0ABR3GHM3_9PEZI